MKIVGKVIKAQTTGDKLEVVVQGKSPTEAHWAAWCAHSVILPDTARSRRAFYVGRDVEIIVTAKRATPDV